MLRHAAHIEFPQHIDLPIDSFDRRNDINYASWILSRVARIIQIVLDPIIRVRLWFSIRRTALL